MSNELRGTIAQALSVADGTLSWRHLSENVRMGYFEKADAVLAALQTGGWELVKLPAPDYIDEPEDDGAKGYGFNGSGTEQSRLSEHGVYAYDGRVFDQYDGWTAKDARAIGAWWIAAAAAAERGVS